MTPPPERAGLKNLGPKSQALLAAAGITTVEQFRELGAVRAFARVKAMAGNHASLNLLWALEGALTGEHWQVVAREHRLSLLLALEAVQGRQTKDPRHRSLTARKQPKILLKS